jgi:hypothetical protein
MDFLLLVVIDNFNVVCAVLFPYEANSELIVHTNAVLSDAGAFEYLKAVSRWLVQIVQVGSKLKMVHSA